MTQSGDDIQSKPISTGMRSSGGEDLARHADIFPPSFLRLIDRFLKPAFAAYAGELDQHWQIDAGDHLDIRPLHGRDGEIGRRAAEHVGQHHDAVAAVDAGERREHVGAPFVEIIVRPDGNGLKLLLRSDHMLERGTKFMREPAMGDDDDADHIAPQIWSARLKAAIFVATVTRRKPEPMPVDEAIVTPLKEAPISA